MNLRQKAAKGIVWSAAQTWGVRAISFLIMLVLARLVLPEAFGLVAYASVFIAFAQIFVDQGFSDAIVQCPKLELEHLDTAFWISLLAGALLTVVGIVASGAIAQLFREPKLAPIVGWLSPSFIFSALASVQQSLLRRQLAFKSLAVRSLAATIVSGLIAVSMAFLGYGVWSLVAKLLVGNLTYAVILWQVSDWRPGFRFSTRHFRELFSFGISILGGNCVDFFSLHADDFLIGYFLGSIVLGYYSLAYNLLIAMTDLLVAVPNVVVFPVFSRLQSELTRIKQLFYQVTQLQSIVAFPVFLGMSVTAPEVVTCLYGQRWNPSIAVVQILMLMGILRSASYFYSSVFKAGGKPSWRFGIWSLTALLNVIGFALVVRRGITAVAAVYVFIGYMLLPLYFLMIRSLIQVTVRTHLKQYVPALCSSLVMVVIILSLKYILGDNLGLSVRLFIFVLVGALTYLSVLRLIQPLLYKQMLDFARLALPRLVSREV
jgi:O-antigen/teichoic acid export membrane protein